MRHSAESLHFLTPAIGLESLTLAGSREVAPAVSIDPPLAPADEAVFLLHTAAEIEHALMVQYLYSFYSLRPEHAAWGWPIRATATEEMGHLITIQNLLTALGAPLNFEREDFPFRTLYPFAFELEPLSLQSLAKYVLAERPENTESVLPPDLETELKRNASVDNQGHDVNRVGLLYARLIQVVEDLPESMFRTGRASRMAEAEDWGAVPAEITRTSGIVTGAGAGFVILPTRNKQEALDALRAIAIQGEGATGSPANPDSHFRRFLDLYKVARADTSPFSWPVPVNPVLSGNGGSSTIVYSPARILAQIANLRYRFLLATLHHLMLLDKSTDQRKALTDWAYTEMISHISSAARLLTGMPRLRLDDLTRLSAVPFELPYTLSIPEAEADRWRGLGFIIDATASRIAALRAETDFGKLDERAGGGLAAALSEIETNDRDRAETIDLNSR